MTDKYILGLSSIANMDSASSIVRFSTDGEILDYVAISEERLIRKKYPYAFPVHAIGYCMDHFGLDSLAEIDAIVGDHMRNEQWFRNGPAFNASKFDYLKLKLDYDPRKITLINHHLAHAASVYYASGFDDAAILIVDGNGSDLQTNSFLSGTGLDIEYLDSYKAHGIGNLYLAVTNLILNLGTGGEGKTMGLAPYGAPYDPVLNIEAEMDGIKTDYSKHLRRMPLSDVLNQMDPKNRPKAFRGDYKKSAGTEQLLEPYFARAAYDVQKETERVMTHLGQELYSQTKSPNLCVSGGVALNSVANQVMFDQTEFENIFVFPACSDCGIPFGLALWGYYNLEGLGDFPRRKFNFANAYSGIEYPENHIKDVLAKYEIPHQKTTPKDVAKLLSENKIVGWFQGGSEYGPRALGHRSILTTSLVAEMRNILNAKVKHRESFRPFAPVVMAEHCEEYFEIKGESPYMLLVAKIKDPDLIPAISHVDGTARVQTVTREANGIFYDLVEEFKKITGVPVLLNTSFNDAGEPIVETPEDAIICFACTEMDYLVIGDFLIDAKNFDKGVAAKMKEGRQAGIKAKEEEYLGRFFTGYDQAECENYIYEMNFMAQWNVKYRAKYELEKKVHEWNGKKKRVLIVGTKDHTEAILKYISGFYNVDVAGFIDFDGRPDQVDGKKVPYADNSWDAIGDIEFDEILISSFEFMYDISEKTRALGLNKPAYEMYDNASRSILDVLVSLPKIKLN